MEMYPNMELVQGVLEDFGLQYFDKAQRNLFIVDDCEHLTNKHERNCCKRLGKWPNLGPHFKTVCYCSFRTQAVLIKILTQNEIKNKNY